MDACTQIVPFNMLISAESARSAVIGVACFGAGALAAWLLTRQVQPKRLETTVITSEAHASAAESDDGDDDDEDTGVLKFSELDRDCNTLPDDVECKVVLCVNQSLNMSKGKTAAQTGHASVGAFVEALRDPSTKAWALAWNFRGAAKITLKIDDTEQMAKVAAAAEAAGLPTYTVEDAGRTEIPAGSLTVLAIGPAPKHLIDAITGPKGSMPLRLLS